MSRTRTFLLAALPAVLGLELPDGVGRLPALGWNSWVGLRIDLFAYGTNIEIRTHTSAM